MNKTCYWCGEPPTMGELGCTCSGGNEAYAEYIMYRLHESQPFNRIKRRTFALIPAEWRIRMWGVWFTIKWAIQRRLV